MCRDVREERKDTRRVVALLALSVLLHAGVLWWFSTREAPPPVRVNRPMTWFDSEVAPPEPETEQATAPQVTPQAAPPVQKKQQKKATAEAVVTETPSGSGSDGPTIDTVPGGSGPAIVQRPNLLPSDNFARGLGTGGAYDTPRGTTTRNSPDEMPDQESLNAYTSDKLSRQLNSAIVEQIGLNAIAVGNVPGHFKSYEKAMRGALPKANIDLTPMTAGDIAKEVLSTAFTTGRPSAEAAAKVADSPMGRSIMNGVGGGPNVEDQRFRESSMQMMAMGEAVKQQIQRVRLRTVLEMTTDPTGALADVEIIEKSGDPKFDESVLHFSRKVARKMPDSDDKMLGSSSWRSRWQFTWEPPDVRVKLINAWRVVDSPSAQ